MASVTVILPNELGGLGHGKGQCAHETKLLQAEQLLVSSWLFFPVHTGYTLWEQPNYAFRRAGRQGGLRQKFWGRG